MKKLLLAFLGIALVLCVASCGDKPEKIVVPECDDEEVYNNALSEFMSVYEKARAEQLDVDKRFAEMAIAEAKLLEAGVMVPLQADGGNYALSKVAPYSTTPILWGNDQDRYSDVIVCTELIKKTDRDALKGIWNEKKGTGTYAAEAIKYLTEKGYTVKDSYSYNYNAEPSTFDVFATSKASDSRVIIYTTDGLLQYNIEGDQVGKLAESYSVSPDGKVYTFNIRKGVKWTDSTGKVIGEVTADDFLAGFQHLIDDPSQQLTWLVQGVVEGVDEYVSTMSDDFSGVGVKKVDDYTIEYHLVEPTSYFTSMFSYSLFNPLNRAYYVSKGGVFGYGKYKDAKDYTYGKTYEDIAYCGPYLIKSHADKNEWSFELNPNYWNAENVRIKNIKWAYVDSSIATAAYDNFKAGLVDGTGLNAAALVNAKKDGYFEDYCYVSGTGTSSFPGFLNLYRRGYANYDDPDGAKTKYTKIADAVRTNEAMQNRDFRLAILFGFDRGVYMEQGVGAELKYTSMVNSYTPGNFVKLEKETTVDINGKPTTFAAGTYYGAIMQAQIEADGFEATVWDPTKEAGLGSSGGFDGWYNAETAKAHMDKAAEALGITTDNPVKIEFVYCEDGSVNTAQAQALKKSIEASTGGLIEVILNGVDEDEYLSATYYYDLGRESNYTLNTNSGWGPDYGDPSSYLDTMMSGGGYMVKLLGLDC